MTISVIKTAINMGPVKINKFATIIGTTATLVTLTSEEEMSNFNMGWNVKAC